ncbi:type III polyketide synthase [Arenibaculum pallidiluteum]|uniref:type III polyketide synthase n=1 Tax=Arenibaculum pallidiluteum TaxID=2812559 RepID=UPI001A962A0B|nr:type III polyketide synthase [Arenibaculum pallidiluteum]
MAAYVNRIGTAVPPFDVHRRFVAYAPSLLPDPRVRKLFGRMADRCQIEHRYSFFRPAEAGEAVDADGFFRPGAFPGTAERMAFYERHAPGLAFSAIEALGLGDDARRITHVIVTTCTGFYAPGLDMQIVDRFGLDTTVERTIIGFMGCFAAINGLKLAHHIVRSEPRAKVLMVNLELCTAHLQESADLETVLSFLIFADGCAACLVSAEPQGIALDGFRAVVIPDSAGHITWHIGQSGFDMHLSGAVPSVLAAGLPAALPEILGGRSRDEVPLWAVHPGGRSVLDAVEQAAGLEPERLSDSRAVLRDFGNMSSATVMFVLERMLRRFRASGMGGNAPGCAMAFGPGMTAETMNFRLAA